MQLVIFDVDGTLTRTNAVDHECFLELLREDAGLEIGDVDWSSFPNVSDTGVLFDLYRDQLGRHPGVAEHERLIASFLLRLERAFERDASRFEAVADSPRAVEHVGALTGHAVAIATGCWRRSALFKLDKARIAHAALPAGYSEDGPARESILAAAVERARAHHGVERFERIVSVGDATWDVRAAARMDLAFVGVGGGARAEKLRSAGGEMIVSDYADLASFERALRQARVPVYRGP